MTWSSPLQCCEHCGRVNFCAKGQEKTAHSKTGSNSVTQLERNLYFVDCKHFITDHYNEESIRKRNENYSSQKYASS